MRKILAAAIFLLASMTPAFAQGFIPAQAPAWVNADNYGRWALPQQNANTYTFTPASICQITQLDYNNTPTFFAFASNVALAPVFIDDVNGTNAEVVTPGSAATQTQSTCAVNIAPVHSHTTFTLQSGTGGLQEAINAVGGTTQPYLTTIVLSAEWYKLISGIASLNATLTGSVTPASVIGGATCSSTVQLLDVTANPWAYYSCNPSTSKFVISNLASKAPTVAAGTGAGTAPTIAITAGSSASSGTITLTSGTATPASDPIFVLTFPASTAGGYAYAPSCTISSVGTPAYTGTVTSAAGGGTATATLTATATALTASTAGYSWTYVCH